MKKLFFFLTVLTASVSFAQKDFQGMAVYESKTSMGDMSSGIRENREITPEMQKMIEERMKKMFEKKFILSFDKSASVYKEEEKLETPGQGQGGMRMMSSFMGGGGTYYKDVKEKIYKVDKEFMGKEFLVKDSLTTYNWQMTGETKEIGGYTCFKATAVVPAATSDFRNFRMPSRNNDKDKKEETKAKEEKSTNLLDQIEMPKEIVVTAWYTPEIPVNQGPEGYWGLPGLILEINQGRTTILCSKVVLNPKDKVQIKAPNTGKQVSQKEYDEVVMKKMEEMSEMGGGGRGFQIRTR